MEKYNDYYDAGSLGRQTKMMDLDAPHGYPNYQERQVGRKSAGQIQKSTKIRRN